MKNQILSTVSALVLTALLSACGGQQDIQPSSLAASTTSASAIEASPAAAGTGTGTGTGTAAAPADAVSAPVVTLAAANMPQPDCAPEGCNSLRIIDGNAEAWRIDAARRAALEARL